MSDLEVIAIKPLAGLTPQMSIGWAGCKKGRENGSHLSLVALEISLANEPNPMDGHDQASKTLSRSSESLPRQMRISHGWQHDFEVWS